MSVQASTLRLRNGAVLAIGPRPPQGPHVARAGYHTLVLAADTYQPPPQTFVGVSVIRVGVPDNRYVPLTSMQRRAIVQASKVVAQHLVAKRNVLCTCEMGLNRSALCATMALVRLGVPRDQAIETARRMRGAIALNNPHFVDMISREPLSRPT